MDKIKDDRSTTSNQFADRLAEALQTRKLSLNRVRAHLKAMGHDVSVASLSYWSTGRSQPTRARSLNVVRALEEVLQVEPGFLVDAMRAGKSELSLDDVVKRQELLPEQMRAHDLPISRLWETDIVLYHVVIGPDSCEHQITTQLGLRAIVTGAYRWAMVVERAEEGELEVVGDEVAPLRRQVQLAPDLTALEFALDQPVERDARIVAGHQITFPPGQAPVSSTGHALRTSARYLSLTVEFTGELPRQVWRSFKGPDDEEATRVVGVTVIGERSVQSVVLEPAPGLHSIAWER